MTGIRYTLYDLFDFKVEWGSQRWRRVMACHFGRNNLTRTWSCRGSSVLWCPVMFLHQSDWPRKTRCSDSNQNGPEINFRMVRLVEVARLLPVGYTSLVDAHGTYIVCFMSTLPHIVAQSICSVDVQQLFRDADDWLAHWGGHLICRPSKTSNHCLIHRTARVQQLEQIGERFQESVPLHFIISTNSPRRSCYQIGARWCKYDHTSVGREGPLFFSSAKIRHPQGASQLRRGRRALQNPMVSGLSAPKACESWSQGETLEVSNRSAQNQIAELVHTAVVRFMCANLTCLRSTCNVETLASSVVEKSTSSISLNGVHEHCAPTTSSAAKWENVTTFPEIWDRQDHAWFCCIQRLKEPAGHFTPQNRDTKEPGSPDDVIPNMLWMLACMSSSCDTSASEFQCLAKSSFLSGNPLPQIYKHSSLFFTFIYAFLTRVSMINQPKQLPRKHVQNIREGAHPIRLHQKPKMTPKFSNVCHGSNHHSCLNFTCHIWSLNSSSHLENLDTSMQQRLHLVAERPSLLLASTSAPAAQQHPADLQAATERREVQRGGAAEETFLGHCARPHPQQVPHGADRVAVRCLEDVVAASGATGRPGRAPHIGGRSANDSFSDQMQIRRNHPLGICCVLKKGNRWHFTNCCFDMIWDDNPKLSSWSPLLRACKHTGTGLGH